MEEMMYKMHDHSGQRSTAIGLAAGLGGAALVGVFAVAWGLNAASKARSIGAYAGIGANTAAIGTLSNNVNALRAEQQNGLAAERSSREGWQLSNQPSIKSYIDIQAQPTAQSVSSATADALALAQAINNGGLNPAIGTESFVRVQRYSAPQPCGCDTCGCGCNS